TDYRASATFDLAGTHCDDPDLAGRPFGAHLVLDSPVRGIPARPQARRPEDDQLGMKLPRNDAWYFQHTKPRRACVVEAAIRTADIAGCPPPTGTIEPSIARDRSRIVTIKG